MTRQSSERGGATTAAGGDAGAGRGQDHAAAGQGALRGARRIEPIVDADWLAANLDASDLSVLDVRPEAAYRSAHVPGAVSAPFVVPVSAWVTLRDGLLLELPEERELFSAIGALGIGAHARVVIVSAPNPGEPPFYGLSAATRVALTLVYAGVRDVAVLDGGFDAWRARGLPTTAEPSTPTPVEYRGVCDAGLLASRADVEARLGRVRLLDARDPEVYFGARVEPFAPRAGHIPSARSLPAPWLWSEALTFHPRAELEAMAAGVIERPKHDELVVYCGVGGYASAWWFVLTQVLGYEDVKLYDGSAQEWVRAGELVAHRWE